MKERARFAFAQARMQARHSQRPGPGHWEQLERSPVFSQLLESARHTGLGPALATLGSDSTINDVDQALRIAFRRRTAAVAGWHPAVWRPALRWVDTLPDLPLVRHLLEGGPAPSWLQRDPRYAPLAEDAERGVSLAAGPLAPLAGADAEGLPKRWRQHWRRLLPRAAASGGDSPLGRLERLLVENWQRLAAPDAATAADFRRRWEALDAELTRLFRRYAQGPAASFAHLGLVWLDLQRLRGALVRRRALA